MPKKISKKRKVVSSNVKEKKKKYPPIFLNIPQALHSQWEALCGMPTRDAENKWKKKYRYSVMGALKKLGIARTTFEQCFAIWRTRNKKWLETCFHSELHLVNSDPTKKLSLVQQICAVRTEVCEEEQHIEDVDEEDHSQSSAESVVEEEDERVGEKEDERIAEEEDERVAEEEDERIKRVTALRTRWQEDEERERDVLVNN